MALIKARPTSPGRRFQVKISRDHLHKGEPEKSLLVHKNSTGARNHFGRQTVRHQGGGHKQKYRLVDFLRNIPIGTTIHNVELKPGKGGQLARSAGGSAQLAAREGTYATIRLRSTETRKVHVECRATIGEVGNDEHNLRSYGTAGAIRWRGVRPTVRGVVMNPVDHPHGGGEGKSGQGNPHPVSPWGWNTKGKKTRRNKRTASMIIRRRN